LTVSAQEPNPRPGRVLNLQPGAMNWTLPAGTAYPMLQMENVQKELGLTPEQKEKIKELNKKSLESMRNDPQLDWTKLRDMTPEERQKLLKDNADRTAKRAAESKKAVEKILTAKQLDQLKDMEFRQRAAIMLNLPRVTEEIELTDEQKDQLQKIREEMQSKMSKLQRESQEKTLGVLTPEQTKKLKELVDKQPAGWGRPVQQLPPPQRPRSPRNAENPSE